MSRQYPKELAVLIGGSFAGTMTQDDNGRLNYIYSSEYAGSVLSLSMPISNASYGDKRVRPFLAGLLPEDNAVRRAIAREHGVSANNPFALAGCIGLDLPGAIQLCQPGDLDALSASESGEYREIGEQEIGTRLAALVDSRDASWSAPDEHWSLGGQQSKIALAQFEGRWYSCEGAAATTHIIKPGIVHLYQQALNEHYCLSLANACGVHAAASEYVVFDEVPAIVVSRFDRNVEAPYVVVRLHQEDLCQSLGVLPENKYAQDGGPSARDVLSLLDAHPNARNNKLSFTSQLLFNYLVGAPDAHAKNYSVFLSDQAGPVLTPLYDVASIFPYQHAGRVAKAAMGIGGEARFEHLSADDLRRYAETAGLEDALVLDLACNLAESVLENVEDVSAQIQASCGEADLFGRIEPKIKDSCETLLRRLEA